MLSSSDKTSVDKNNNLLEYVLLNARSVKNKLPELHLLIYDLNCPSIVCICKSWLNYSITNSMLDPLNRFTIFRLDRPQNREGGGVCVFVDRDIGALLVEISGSDFVDLEVVAVDIVGKDKFRLITMYREGYKCRRI